MQGVTTSQHRHRRTCAALVLACAIAAGCSQIAGLGGFKDAPDAGTGAGTSSTSSSAGGSGGSSSASAGVGGSGGAGGSCNAVGCPPVQIVAASGTQDIAGFALDVGTDKAATAVFWLDRGSGTNADGGAYRTPNTPNATSMTVTVAANQCGPRAIITDGFNEYWVVENPPGCPGTSGGQVWSASLDLKNVTMLYGGEQGPIAIAEWLFSLYWVTAGGVRSGAKSGSGTASTLTSQVAAPTSVATDGTWVYWTEKGPPASLGRVKNDMTMAGLLASTLNAPTKLALDLEPFSTTPYWTDTGTKTVSYFQGGTVKTLIGGNGPSPGLAIAGGKAYWADTVDGSIHATPLSGGTDVLLAQHQAAPTAVALDAKSVFWLTTGGGKGTGIWRAPR